MTTSLVFGGSTSTAAATAMWCVGMLTAPPTMSSPGANSQYKYPVRAATAFPIGEKKDTKAVSSITTDLPELSPTHRQYFASVAVRETSATEKVVGEFRRMAGFSSGWDGEGAAAPLLSSLDSASDFVRLLPKSIPVADAMLNANGRAGLFWNDGGVYADLEFLGDGRIAYFVQRGEDKHKGVLHFNGEILPPIFSTILQSPEVG